VETIDIYTDGSSKLYNGVWYGGASAVTVYDSTRVLLPVDYVALPHATSQLCEIYAAILGLSRFIKQHLCRNRCNISVPPGCVVRVVSDSEYVVNSYNHYLKLWNMYGWVKTNGEPVAHREYWQSLQAHAQCIKNHGYRVKFTKIKAHQKTQHTDDTRQSMYSQWNNEADRRAREAMKYAMDIGITVPK
jgi:ribonuclease HI